MDPTTGISLRIFPNFKNIFFLDHLICLTDKYSSGISEKFSSLDNS